MTLITAGKDVPAKASEASRKEAGKRTVVRLPSTEREAYFNELLDALAATGQVFAKGEQVYTDRGGTLQAVANGNNLAKLAGRLVNVVRVDTRGNAQTIDPPAGEGSFILASAELRSRLPRIRYAAQVPVLDDDFQVARPGFNARCGVYYEGPAVQPRTAPEHLDRLLDAFCWKRPVDRVNFLGFLLTPFLGPRFAGGRPICILKGNQPGIGKTAAGQVIALVHSPDEKLMSVNFKDDDVELEKCIGAAVRHHNCVLVDNVKPSAKRRVISSQAIERTVTLPTFSFRRIGTSEVITGDNYLQWVLTFNGGELSTDLSSRTYLGDSREGDERQAALEELAAARPNEYLRPAQWLAEAQRLHLFKEQLAGRPARSRQTIVGTILRACCGREILLEEEGSPPRVFRLERREDRNGSLYAFLAPVPQGQPGVSSAGAVGLRAQEEALGPAGVVKVPVTR